MNEPNTKSRSITILVASGRGVAERWRGQYSTDGKWRVLGSVEPKKIYDQLVALGNAPTPHDVARVIGNRSWSFIACNGCGDSVERAAVFEQQPDHRYCGPCLFEACAAIAAKPEPQR